MLPYEYVFILTSLIIGLGIAELLKGYSDLLSNWRSYNLSVAHLLYSLVIFLLLVQEWFIEYVFFQNVKDWTMLTVLAMLIFPLILFLQTRLIFPTGILEGETDLCKYYQTEWKRLYILGAMGVSTSLVNNLLTGYTIDTQLPQMLYLGLYLIFLFFPVEKERLHIVFNGAQLVALLVYIFTSTESL